jgi:hypothetical protein
VKQIEKAGGEFIDIWDGFVDEERQVHLHRLRHQRTTGAGFADQMAST